MIFWYCLLVFGCKCLLCFLWYLLCSVLGLKLSFLGLGSWLKVMVFLELWLGC